MFLQILQFPDVEGILRHLVYPQNGHIYIGGHRQTRLAAPCARTPDRPPTTHFAFVVAACLPAACLLRDTSRLIRGAAIQGEQLSRYFPKMDLKSKVALVTGAAAGIGKAFATELLNQGVQVAVCDIDVAQGEKLVEILTSDYGKDRVIYCQCDVTDYSQFEDAFQKTIATFGHIDIVVNNAGIMNDRFWELEVDINVNGVIRGTLLAQRFMRTDMGRNGGIVVNIGSNVSIDPYHSVPIYSATKAAIVNFTRAFGHQYHVDLTGVKVMALCPSAATDSQLLKDVSRQLLWLGYADAWRSDIATSVPQRMEHVAKALVHVLTTGKSGSVWLVEKDQPPYEHIFTKS